MTRRDYCSECGEMVNDNDVTCVECSASQCSDCITPYDYQSALFVLYTRFNTFFSDTQLPYIFAKELEPYLEHIRQMVNDGNALVAGNNHIAENNHITENGFTAAGHHTLPGTTRVLSERGYDYFIRDYDTIQAATLLLAIEHLVAEYKDKDTSPDTKIHDGTFVASFVECFRAMDECDIYTFCCYDCHINITNTQHMLRLEATMASLAKQNKDLRAQLEKTTV